MLYIASLPVPVVWFFLSSSAGYLSTRILKSDHIAAQKCFLFMWTFLGFVGHICIGHFTCIAKLESRDKEGDFDSTMDFRLIFIFRLRLA